MIVSSTQLRAWGRSFAAAGLEAEAPPIPEILEFAAQRIEQLELALPAEVEVEEAERWCRENLARVSYSGGFTDASVNVKVEVYDAVRGQFVVTARSLEKAVQSMKEAMEVAYATA